MILFPAIDIKDSQCVRLLRGDLEKSEIFNSDPVDQAKIFEKLGFKTIHIVDLNGAVKGHSVNKDVIKLIVDSVSLPVQLGGGIRDLDSIEEWLNIGVKKIIIGTAAFTNPELLSEACKHFPKKIILGIDARHEMIATDGWTKTTKENFIDFAKKFNHLDLYAIIFTDINRDGMMEGINIKQTLKLAQSVDIPIIASGGIKDIEDIKLIAQNEENGIIGAIIGKSYYSGNLDPKKALEI